MTILLWNYRHNCLLLVTLGMALSLSVRAQVTDGAASADDRAAAHSMSGVLLDPSGAAIPNAQVTLLGNKGEVLFQTAADDVGAFHFDNVAPGKYIMECSAEGFVDTRTADTVTGKPV